MGISVTEIQTNLHIWTCCNQIQQYSSFIIYTMWLIMFNKMCFYCNIYEMKLNIFEIFKTFSRYLGKKFEIFRKKHWEFPET